MSVSAFGRRARGDRGESLIQALLVLAAWGAVLWLAFMLISAVVGPAMNNPGGGGGSDRDYGCGPNGIKPRADGTCP